MCVYRFSFTNEHRSLLVVTLCSGAVCGGLTASVTLGFVHGLVKGRKFHDLKDIHSKSKMLAQNYSFAVIAALGMALCANQWLRNLVFPSKYLLATVVAVLSGSIASSLSFQFYQIPQMAASTFGHNRAVCLSLMDGLGFFLCAPVWAATNQLVSNFGKHGWSLTWILLAALFSLGGKSMMGIIPTVIKKQQLQQQAA